MCASVRVENATASPDGAARVFRKATASRTFSATSPTRISVAIQMLDFRPYPE